MLHITLHCITCILLYYCDGICISCEFAIVAAQIATGWFLLDPVERSYIMSTADSLTACLLATNKSISLAVQAHVKTIRINLHATHLNNMKQC